MCLPATLDRVAPATVLFSHAHQDHWGLIGELPAHWPLWSGEKAAEMMRISADLARTPLPRPILTWRSRARPFAIGPFTVTPILTDHSAPDAYMLLIDIDGRRILYTGDFRAHGRKAKLVEALIAAPPTNVDVLVMEGTNLGTDKPVLSENALEQRFVALANTAVGHVFVNWSAQNIDRTVTLFRAAKRTGRTLLVDLYGAHVLERIAAGTGIPRPGLSFPEVKVLITRMGRRMYESRGYGEWIDSIACSPYATSIKRLAGSRAIVMARDSMVREFGQRGLPFTPDDAYVFSSWRGYLDDADPKTGWARAKAAGASVRHLHTSGHASAADLARFAAAIAPTTVVPVHGDSWDEPGVPLPPIRRLTDGDRCPVPLRAK